MFVFLGGISTFIFNSLPLNLLGCFLIYFSVVLDGCDGEIARLKNNTGRVGSIYTEPISHDIQYALMFIPLTIGVYLSSGSIVTVYVGFFATIAKMLQRFLSTRFDQLLFWQRADVDSGKAAFHGFIQFEKDVSLLHKIYRWLNRNIFSSVGLIIPLLLFTLLRRIDLFIWLFATYFTALMTSHFIKQVITIRKMNSNNINPKKITAVLLAPPVRSPF